MFCSLQTVICTSVGEVDGGGDAGVAASLGGSNARLLSLQQQQKDQNPCPVCGHKFLWRWMLVRHMMTHTGEKPYSCPHCDYKAARKEQVRSHIYNKHNIKK